MTSSIATSVSQKYNTRHSDLAPTDPQVLLAGFRVAGWTCCASLLISLAIAVVGLRGIGLVGQRPYVEKTRGELELDDLQESTLGGSGTFGGGASRTSTISGGEGEDRFVSSSKTWTAVPSQKSRIKSVMV